MSDVAKKTQSAAQKAVNKVKAAPQKIVEHALNTAISTVEKAAEIDVKRTAKKVARTTKKLEKAQKIARRAKSEAKRANDISSKLNKIQKKEAVVKSANNIKGVIKDKIKEIILPQKEYTFHYDRRQLIVLTALYIIIAIFVYIISENLHTVQMFNNSMLHIFLRITQILTLGALASTVYVLLFPQKLAIINKDGIKIDHNELLNWQDIEFAEEKYTSSILYRPFIALHVAPRNLKKYKLTFMQKLCQKNIFTPFSIPLYAMRPEDSSNIRDLIRKHVEYKDSRDEIK